jgi:hypothetical protein
MKSRQHKGAGLPVMISSKCWQFDASGKSGLATVVRLAQICRNLVNAAPLSRRAGPKSAISFTPSRRLCWSEGSVGQPRSSIRHAVDGIFDLGRLVDAQASIFGRR